MLEYVEVWMGSVFGARSHHTLQLIFVIGTCINFIRSTPKPQNKINEIFNIKKMKKKALHFWTELVRGCGGHSPPPPPFPQYFFKIVRVYTFNE